MPSLSAPIVKRVCKLHETIAALQYHSPLARISGEGAV